MVFYEAPHRLQESLADMLSILGDREIVIGPRSEQASRRVSARHDK